MEPEHYGRPVTTRLPVVIVELIDMLVKQGFFRSRAEAVRCLVTRAAVDYAVLVQALESKEGEKDVR
jgi:Arc/MetJ-type ribon-helix-helix transcriptional regulator